MRYFLLSLILLVGCSGTLNEKKNERVSQSVYATNDSLNKSRVDLAKKYSDETIRLIDPPKKRIPISSITFTKIDPETRRESQESIVVLPESSTGRTIRLNSEEYFELLKEREIAKKFAEGEKQWQKYSEEVSIQIKKDAELKHKLSEELKSIKNKKMGVFDLIKYGVLGILIIPLLVIGIIIAWLISILVRIFKKQS